MKKMIKGGTSGKTLSADYIKCELFDWLCDYEDFEIDGVPATEIVERIQAMRPEFGIDDVLYVASELSVSIVEALEHVEAEYEAE